jgi:hypothetical protein
MLEDSARRLDPSGLSGPAHPVDWSVFRFRQEVPLGLSFPICVPGWQWGHSEVRTLELLQQAPCHSHCSPWGGDRGTVALCRRARPLQLTAATNKKPTQKLPGRARPQGSPQVAGRRQGLHLEQRGLSPLGRWEAGGRLVLSQARPGSTWLQFSRPHRATGFGGLDAQCPSCRPGISTPGLSGYLAPRVSRLTPSPDVLSNDTH